MTPVDNGSHASMASRPQDMLHRLKAPQHPKNLRADAARLAVRSKFPIGQMT